MQNTTVDLWAQTVAKSSPRSISSSWVDCDTRLPILYELGGVVPDGTLEFNRAAREQAHRKTHFTRQSVHKFDHEWFREIPTSSSSAAISALSSLNSFFLRSMNLCVRIDFSRTPLGVRM